MTRNRDKETTRSVATGWWQRLHDEAASGKTSILPDVKLDSFDTKDEEGEHVLVLKYPQITLRVRFAKDHTTIKKLSDSQAPVLLGSLRYEEGMREQLQQILRMAISKTK